MMRSIHDHSGKPGQAHNLYRRADVEALRDRRAGTAVRANSQHTGG